MIKIDTDFNLNVLLKLFFFFLKKLFFSSILANNNLPVKIYCENILITFPSSFFPFFPHLFLSSTHGISFFLFSFFSPLFFSSTHVPLPVLYFPSFLHFSPCHSSKLQNVLELSFFLFFFFFPF